jgi:hypothetical protein
MMHELRYVTVMGSHCLEQPVPKQETTVSRFNTCRLGGNERPIQPKPY